MPLRCGPLRGFLMPTDTSANAGALMRYLDQLSATHFYGGVTLRYEAGRIVHVKVEQTMRPTDLPAAFNSSSLSRSSRPCYAAAHHE
jgi:hypothetical protein